MLLCPRLRVPLFPASPRPPVPPSPRLRVSASPPLLLCPFAPPLLPKQRPGRLSAHPASNRTTADRHPLSLAPRLLAGLIARLALAVARAAVGAIGAWVARWQQGASARAVRIVAVDQAVAIIVEPVAADLLNGRRRAAVARTTARILARVAGRSRKSTPHRALTEAANPSAPVLYPSTSSATVYRRQTKSHLPILRRNIIPNKAREVRRKVVPHRIGRRLKYYVD